MVELKEQRSMSRDVSGYKSRDTRTDKIMKGSKDKEEELVQDLRADRKPV